MQKKNGTCKGFGIGRKGGSSRQKQNLTGRKQVRTRHKEIHILTEQKQDRLGSNVTRRNGDRTGWKKDRSGHIQNGRKQDCSGRIDNCQKRDRMGCMQTDWKADRYVPMFPLVCDEAFLSFFQICLVPDTIASYSVGIQHRCSCVVSHARNIIPVLWNIDKIGSIVQRLLQSKVVHSRSLDKVSSYDVNSELTQGIQELHALVCAYLYAVRVIGVALPTRV